MCRDDLGLVPTLRRYIQTLMDKHGIRIDFSSTGRDRRLPSDDEVAIFRLIQDSLVERIECVGEDGDVVTFIRAGELHARYELHLARVSVGLALEIGSEVVVIADREDVDAAGARHVSHLGEDLERDAPPRPMRQQLAERHAADGAERRRPAVDGELGPAHAREILGDDDVRRRLDDRHQHRGIGEQRSREGHQLSLTG